MIESQKFLSYQIDSDLPSVSYIKSSKEDISIRFWAKFFCHQIKARCLASAFIEGFKSSELSIKFVKLFSCSACGFKFSSFFLSVLPVIVEVDLCYM